MILAVVASPSVDVTYVVDELVPGEIHRPPTVHRLAGGKGINVARVAHRLGADVTATGIVGGPLGAWITSSLAAEGVSFAPVPGAGDTRMCVSIADATTASLTEVYEPGTPVSGAEWESLERKVRELASGRAWMTISGAFPNGTPPDAVARLVEIGHSAGSLVAVDTHSAALARGLRSGADLIKVNASEAAAVLGVPDDAPPAFLCRGLRERCSNAETRIVVTAGRDGAVALFPFEPVRRIGANAIGRYSVGSGDAFMAGLVSALADGADPDAALIVATSAAAANAAIPGAGLLDSSLLATSSSSRTPPR